MSTHHWATALAFCVASLMPIKSSIASMAVWVDPTRPYQAGTVNGQPLFVQQAWGLRFTVPSDMTVLESVTLTLDLRNTVYVPNDGSPDLRLELFAWSNSNAAPIGAPIWSSQRIYPSDLTAPPIDPYGSKPYTFGAEVSLQPEQTYFMQLRGGGFVLFGNSGSAQAQLLLNQNSSGWVTFPNIDSSLTFRDTSPVPEPATHALFAIGALILRMTFRARRLRSLQ